jgi:hypothetical protein
MKSRQLLRVIIIEGGADEYFKFADICSTGRCVAGSGDPGQYLNTGSDTPEPQK